MLDTMEFKRGRAGEQIAAKWLQHKGWFVVPSYDYSGQDGKKPPRLQGKLAGFAIPDLDIAKDGNRLWVEVKLKGEASLHNNTNTLEHGISWRLFEHYQHVERITGTHVWLLVIEENTKLLLGNTLRGLREPRRYTGTKMGPSGMAFWPRASFHEIATLKLSEVAA